jgi:phospholipid/cholesterol/gamma-HCH transport system ATP-binding protein
MIQLRDVYKSFGPKEVLRGFSLDVAEGKNTVLLGFSGSGKSVTLKLIAGLLAPDSGDVLVDGKNVPDLDADGLALLRRDIAFVFQFAALFDSMTVEENIRLGLRKQGLDDADQRVRVRESLALVNLEGTEGRYPAELSGGMRKRVGIARAVALKPRYILYDEPTTGLDPVTSAVIDDLMVRTRDLGATGLIVTHDLRTSFKSGDRIAMLYEGRLRAMGTPDDLRRSEDPVVSGFIEGRPTTPAGVA